MASDDVQERYSKDPAQSEVQIPIKNFTKNLTFHSKKGLQILGNMNSHKESISPMEPRIKIFVCYAKILSEKKSLPAHILTIYSNIICCDYGVKYIR